ncbi:hypothetical protein BT69DRAFT_326308 [Atractiella rhizophila]|nr:hypothetical protein BT69DRAFT_326308 [Atractiella rhizophila]
MNDGHGNDALGGLIVGHGHGGGGGTEEGTHHGWERNGYGHEFGVEGEGATISHYNGTAEGDGHGHGGEREQLDNFWRSSDGLGGEMQPQHMAEQAHYPTADASGHGVQGGGAFDAYPYAPPHPHAHVHGPPHPHSEHHSPYVQAPALLSPHSTISPLLDPSLQPSIHQHSHPHSGHASSHATPHHLSTPQHQHQHQQHYVAHPAPHLHHQHQSHQHYRPSVSPWVPPAPLVPLNPLFLTSLPALGQTRCYWAILSCYPINPPPPLPKKRGRKPKNVPDEWGDVMWDMRFEILDPVLMNHLGEEKELLRGRELWELIEEGERGQARKDIQSLSPFSSLYLASPLQGLRSIPLPLLPYTSTSPFRFYLALQISLRSFGGYDNALQGPPPVVVEETPQSPTWFLSYGSRGSHVCRGR